jgi:predicted aspartyl protease
MQIPFRFAREDAPLVLVRARLGDRIDAELIVDTGNGAPLPILITPTLAAELGLQATETISTHGATIDCIRLPRLVLGELVQNQVQAGVLQAIEDIGAKLGVRIDGNIGRTFLEGKRLRIDYANRLLGISPGGGKSAGGIPFESTAQGSLVVIRARVNGHGPFPFVVDTGASATVLSPTLAGRLGLSGEVGETMGVMGGLDAQVVTLESLEAGGKTLKGVSAAVIDIFDYTSQGAGTQVEGIIGHTFLKEFVVEFDYEERTLTFVSPVRAGSD